MIDFVDVVTVGLVLGSMGAERLRWLCREAGERAAQVQGHQGPGGQPGNGKSAR